MDSTDSIRLYHNSSVYATKLYEADKSIEFVIQNTDLSTGNNVFSAVSTDSVGNESAPISLTLILDTAVPTIGNIPDQGDKTAAFTVDPATYLDGTGSNIATYTWTVTKGGPVTITNQGTTVFAVNASPNTLDLATDGTADGDYTVSLVVTDEAGNESASESFTFGWDGNNDGAKSISSSGSKPQNTAGPTGSGTGRTSGRINISPAETADVPAAESSAFRNTYYRTEAPEAAEKPSSLYNGGIYRAPEKAAAPAPEAAPVESKDMQAPEAEPTAEISTADPAEEIQYAAVENAEPEAAADDNAEPEAAADDNGYSLDEPVFNEPVEIPEARPARTAAPASSLASKAAASVTGKTARTAAPAAGAQEQAEAAEPIGILPFVIILLMVGGGAVIIIRKRKI